jgi:hypothetical protein
MGDQDNIGDQPAIQRAGPWIAGGLLLAMVIGATVATITGRSLEQLLPFYGIIAGQLGLFTQQTLNHARTTERVEEIRANVNGHLQQHIDGSAQ